MNPFIAGQILAFQAYFQADDGSPVAPTTCTAKVDRVDTLGDLTNVASPTVTISLVRPGVALAYYTVQAADVTAGALDFLCQFTATGATLESLSLMARIDPRLTAALVSAEEASDHTATLNAIAALNNLSTAQVQAIVDGLNDPTLTAIVDAVLDELLSGHTIAGSVGAGISDASAASATPEEVADEVWLNAPSNVVTDLTDDLSPDLIPLRRGDRWNFSLTGMLSLSGATDVVFTIKSNKYDEDEASLVQIRESSGLVYINRATAPTPANGSLTVDDAAAGDITITLEGVETAKLHPGEYHYDVQRVGAATDPATRAEGVVRIKADVTRAVV